MVTRYLPKFNQIEPENLLGLTAGLVVAQLPVKYEPATTTEEESYGVVTVEKNGYKFIENGALCTIDVLGKSIVDYTAAKVSLSDRPLFIHFTEELNTVLSDRKYFAVECEQEETFLRLVALVPGSVWTTNICTNAAEEAIYNAAISAGKIRCINENAVLPNGDPAKTYICIA